MTSRRPKGALVAIGGNEDKTADKNVLRKVIDLPKGGCSHVEVLPTASTMVSEVSKDYLRAFRDLGVRRVDIIDIRERADADKQDFADRVHDADLVYLTGGDQLRLTHLLGGSKTAQAISDTYHAGGVVAGTSAGAAAMSTTMIAGDDGKTAMRKNSVTMAPGLGLVPDCVIDTHFLDRGRVARLLEVVSTNPGYTGFGVGEDTGMVIREGNKVEVVGSGIVVVVEAHEMRHSNVSQIAAGEPIAAERVILHTLVEGYGWDFEDKTFVMPREPRDERK